MVAGWFLSSELRSWFMVLSLRSRDGLRVVERSKSLGNEPSDA